MYIREIISLSLSPYIYIYIYMYTHIHIYIYICAGRVPAPTSARACHTQQNRPYFVHNQNLHCLYYTQPLLIKT